MQGMKVVFSGFRDPKLEDLITRLGGRVMSAVSSRTTVLVVQNTFVQTTKVSAAAKHNVKVQLRQQFRKDLLRIRRKKRKPRNERY